MAMGRGAGNGAEGGLAVGGQGLCPAQGDGLGGAASAGDGLGDAASSAGGIGGAASAGDDLGGGASAAGGPGGEELCGAQPGGRLDGGRDGLLALARRVLEAHRESFDLESPYALDGREFFGYGEYHAEASSYVLSKKAKLWEVKAHEYLYVSVVEHLDGQALDRLVAFMKTSALGQVQVDENHMASYLSLAVIARDADPAIEKMVKRTRFRKNFRGGWHGWADLRLAVVDFSRSSVYCNGQGKPLGQTLEANLPQRP